MRPAGFDLFSGCHYGGLDLATLYITQDENGMVYEIYTEHQLCELEIYGNMSMRVVRENLKEAAERTKKAYGKPAEENDTFRMYIKYKTDTEYAYVIKRADSGVIIRLGIVADKPALTDS